MRGLGEAAYITWMSFGVEIDKINESADELELFISVPKSSYKKDVDNNEMASDFLAKRFKTVLSEMGVKRLVVKYRIRNECWTEKMSKQSIKEATQTIYGGYLC